MEQAKIHRRLHFMRFPVRPASGLVRSLQATIDDVIAAFLPAGGRVAHVGFPNHWNTGDPAIWLGTQAALARRGCNVAYQCAWQDYDRELMSQQIGSSPILIAGGGNLGDLWPNHQLFRERIRGTNIEYHLARGVGFFIVMNHLSTDSTAEILENYRRAGVAEVIHQEHPGYLQGKWVTWMARRAATLHGADWVIKCDQKIWSLNTR